MSTGLRFFIAYWVIGILIVIFVSLPNKKIQKGFREDTFTYFCVGVLFSLVYPIALIKGIIERSKKNNEGE